MGRQEKYCIGLLARGELGSELFAKHLRIPRTDPKEDHRDHVPENRVTHLGSSCDRYWFVRVRFTRYFRSSEGDKIGEPSALALDVTRNRVLVAEAAGHRILALALNPPKSALFAAFPAFRDVWNPMSSNLRQDFAIFI